MNSLRALIVGVALLAIVGVGFVPDVRSALPAGRGPAVALGAPRYVEETATAGVDHVYGGGFEYATGGGGRAVRRQRGRKARPLPPGGHRAAGALPDRKPDRWGLP